MVYRQPTLAPLGRPVEGDLFQRFSPQKRSKGCQPGEMAVYNPRENRCRARKPDIYFTMVVSFRTTRRAFHASASVFAVPDPEVSETRGSWFEHPAMPLGFGALCAVPGATSWCVFCPFSRCQRVPYRNVAMPIDARVRPPRAVPGDPRARVGLPRSETPRTSSPPPLTPRPRPPFRQVAPGRRRPRFSPSLAPERWPRRPCRRAPPLAARTRPRRAARGDSRGCHRSHRHPALGRHADPRHGQDQRAGRAHHRPGVRLEQAGLGAALGRDSRRIRRGVAASPPELNPPGTTVYKQKALQSPFPAFGALQLVLDPGVTAVEFCLTTSQTGEWFNDGGRNYRVELGPPGGAGERRTPALTLRRRTTSPRPRRRRRRPRRRRPPAPAWTSRRGWRFCTASPPTCAGSSSGSPRFPSASARTSTRAR